MYEDLRKRESVRVVLSSVGTKSKTGEDILVTWDNPEELERYIKKLQAAAETLTTENRKLRRCHITVSEKVRKGIHMG